MHGGAIDWEHLHHAPASQETARLLEEQHTTSLQPPFFIVVSTTGIVARVSPARFLLRWQHYTNGCAFDSVNSGYFMLLLRSLVLAFRLSPGFGGTVRTGALILPGYSPFVTRTPGHSAVDCSAD